jgi:hypothetical protein
MSALRGLSRDGHVLLALRGQECPRYTERGYNACVATPAPQKPAADDHHRHRHPIYAAEATGLLLMAVLLLILTIVRYWSYIQWSAR